MQVKERRVAILGGEPPAGIVQRAGLVLILFAESPEPTLGVTEIAQATGLSKGVIHRLLNAMADSGLVELVESNRRYRLGPLALSLGLAYLTNFDLRERTRPILERLSYLTGETATLSIQERRHRVYIDQVNPANEIRMTVPIGRPFPLHAGSSSKAFLAFLGKEFQDEYFETSQLESLTDLTITDVDRLKEELELIAKRGYAQSNGEREPGAVSIAAPVLDHHGEVIGVISICGPGVRFRNTWKDAVDPLLDATKDLSRRLGFKG